MPIEFKLLELIKKKGLEGKPWREIAKEIGISHGPLFQMATNAKRNGKPYNPTLSMLDRLCHYFKCQPGDLLKFRRH